MPWPGWMPARPGRWSPCPAGRRPGRGLHQERSTSHERNTGDRVEDAPDGNGCGGGRPPSCDVQHRRHPRTGLARQPVAAAAGTAGRERAGADRSALGGSEEERRRGEGAGDRLHRRRHRRGAGESRELASASAGGGSRPLRSHDNGLHHVRPARGRSGDRSVEFPAAPSHRPHHRRTGRRKHRGGQAERDVGAHIGSGFTAPA